MGIACCERIDAVFCDRLRPESRIDRQLKVQRSSCAISRISGRTEEDDNSGRVREGLVRRPRLNVNSDTESDDDNVPISKLKRMHLQEKVPEIVGSDLNDCSVTDTISVGNNVMDIITPPRRRLMTLRKCEGKVGAGRNNLSQASETKYHQGIPTREDVEDEDSEEAGSESEGESLGGFIVESSDVSHADDASSESQDVSDDNVDFDEILSKLQRNKDHTSEWEFEADMLAAFGKDIELCMKAVCALYRQQTSEEKLSKETFYYNGRGFSKFDAERYAFECI